MKIKITILSLAIATIFSSCSKEHYFTTSNQNYGRFHNTEQFEVKETNTAAAEEVSLTASAENSPVIINQTPSFTTPKAGKAGKSETAAASAEPGLEKVSVMTKKEVKALVKAAKKEAKAAKDIKEGEGKSQIIALALAILVGWASAHRFYLGYTKIGILQILSVLLCGVGLIWVLIDLIRIITGDLKPNGSDYAQKL